MASPNSREGAAGASTRRKSARTRDWWDKAEIIGKVMTGLLPAILVASIGYFGQHFTQSLENNRLYTELLTRREQADTDLRRNMFSVLITEFLAGRAEVGSIGAAGPVATAKSAPRGARAKAEQLLSLQLEKFEDDLLKLELLATNFAESLTLSPLFEKLNRDLSKLEDRAKKDDAIAFRAIGLRKRLVGLAQRISESQIAAIKAVGYARTITVPTSAAGKEFVWPFDEPNFAEDSGGQGTGLGPGSVECGKIVRRFAITFSQPDKEQQRVRIQLSASKIAELRDPRWWSPFAAEPVLVDNPENVEKKFTLDFFNFPLIDNTRLSDDQRFALVMTHFDENEIVVTALCFSGTYSSVRDRPFINEIVESLTR